MTTRKEFIKNSLFGMFGIASADAIASVADNTTKISEEKYSQVCEYMAEKYVDKNVMGPYNDRNGTWYSMNPVGFVYSPNEHKRRLIEIPFQVRKTYSDMGNYDVFVRKSMISKLKKWLIENNICEKMYDC